MNSRFYPCNFSSTFFYEQKKTHERSVPAIIVSFAKGFSKHPHIFPIFKVVSEYSRLPFKLKVDYFILYWILVSTFVIFLPFFAMNKRRCTDEAENSSFIRMCTFSSVTHESTGYQYVISSKKSSGHHISVSIKGTFYLSLFFLEWSSFSYFSCYISLGFTIRTVRTQNNHWGFEFNQVLSSKLVSLYDSLLAQLKRAIINFCIWQQAKLMLKRVNG